MNQIRTTTHHVPLPAFRAAAFAVVGTVLGASAHHLVDGGPVPWRQCAAAAAVLFGVGLAGTRRPRSLTAVVATCSAAQAGLHVWLMREHADASPGMTMNMPGHMDHAADSHSAWHERLHASTAMTVTHTLAAVLVAVLLHRADAVCWTLARGLTTAVEAVRARIATAHSLLGDRPVPAQAGTREAVALARLERPPPQSAVLMDVVVRRGPPQAELALAN
ncbi:hypothetical protein ACQPXS_35680 [Streptomyces sp. CA-142005]|uniref:hypothetical protein n=1 Tax=Streptomyces sp. CA-142005 TaxID=3240052 RepID=UPI003D935963